MAIRLNNIEKEYIMNTVKTNIRSFKSRAKTNAYMTRFTATAKRLGFIPHYSISINGRSIVITLTARPLYVKPCANAFRPLCKDKNDLINTVHNATFSKPYAKTNFINYATLTPTRYSRLIISHLV